MTTLPNIISLSNLERQTGMTTLGVSLVNGAVNAADHYNFCPAPTPLFIAPNQRMRQWVVDHRALHPAHAVWADALLRDNGMTPSLAVIDDCDEYKFHDLRHLIGAAVNRMQTITTPCQIVLLRNPFNVKDLF